MPCADAWWKFNSIHVRELRSDSSPPRYGQLRWKSLANFAFKDLNLSFEASDPVFNRARDHLISIPAFLFSIQSGREKGARSWDRSHRYTRSPKGNIAMKSGLALLALCSELCVVCPRGLSLNPSLIPLPTTRNHDIHAVRNANSCRRDILRQIRMDHNAYIMESNVAPTWIILSSDDTPGWNCAKFVAKFTFLLLEHFQKRWLLSPLPFKGVVFIFIRSIRNENVRLETNVLYLFIFRIVDRIDGGIFIVWIFRFSYCGRRKKEWRWRCKASKDCLKYMNINDSPTPQLNVPCYKETSFM